MKRAATNGDWTGIHAHGAGWRAVVSRGRGAAPSTRHFPKDTSLAKMQEWREDERATLRLQRKQRASQGTFEGDARRYLRSVHGMTSHRDRTRDINIWIGVFGTKRRETIDSAIIREWRDRWHKEPRGYDKEGEPLPPYAASTINHRLRALSNLWTVLDGRRAPNPVREVDELREPAPRPRSRDYTTIELILGAMPDRGRPKDGKRPKFSASKVRATCLAYCQVTPKQLGQLTAADVDLKGKRLRLPARSKGAGAEGRWVSLLPPAVDAFTAFDDLGLYGPYSVQSLDKSWARAQAALNRARASATPPLPPVEPMRLYDLRHSWGAMAYRATLSLEAVGDMMQHADRSTTRRYAMDAEEDVAAAHSATIHDHFARATVKRSNAG